MNADVLGNLTQKIRLEKYIKKKNIVWNKFDATFSIHTDIFYVYWILN